MLKEISTVSASSGVEKERTKPSKPGLSEEEGNVLEAGTPSLSNSFGLPLERNVQGKSFVLWSAFQYPYELF